MSGFAHPNDMLRAKGADGVRDWFDNIKRPRPETPKRRFHAYTEYELDALEPPEWLVEDLIPAKSFTAIYGPPGCGKSFLALDIARSVETGARWRGKIVKQGLVIYIAAEGGNGFRSRVRAFRQNRPGLDYAGRNFRLITACPELGRKDADIDELILDIQAASADHPEGPAQIIVDTVAQTLAGEDENGDGMTAFIFNMQRLQTETGAAITAVHHVGHEGTRPRGHSSFMGALDAAILVKADSESSAKTAKVTKMKDAESGEKFDFELEKIELGFDQNGKPYSSCVVRHTAPPAPSAAARPSRRHKTQAEIDADLILSIAQILGNSGTSASCPAPEVRDKFNGTTFVPLGDLRAECWSRGFHSEDKPETRKKAFQRAISKLCDDGHLSIWEDWLCLADR